MSLGETERTDLEETRAGRLVVLVVHDVHESGDVEEHEAAGEAIGARERTEHGSTDDREPQVAIAQVVLGLLLDQVRYLGLLLAARDGYDAIDEAVALVHSQPPVANEVELLACLQIVHDHKLQEPGGLGARARVVVPDAQVVQRTERTEKTQAYIFQFEQEQKLEQKPIS